MQWGDKAFSRGISVNDHDVSVTQSAAEALDHLRLASEPRALWIDALCINQLDSGERNHQVRRMGSIYANARRTIVFLGAEGDSSLDACDLITRLSLLEEGDHQSISDMLGETSLERSWKALKRFFTRHWWSRAWIVQEYAVSADVLFVCGDVEFNGQLFSKALRNLRHYRFNANMSKKDTSMIERVASTQINHLLTIRHKYQDKAQRNMDAKELHALEILYRLRASRCSDDRDKVFSIFGLAQPGTLVEPNYNMSTEQVYVAVVLKAIQKSRTLRVLTHHNQSVRSRLNLPTWCPDWTVRHGKRITLWNNGYDAARRQTLAEPVDIDGRILKLQASRIDCIKFSVPFPSEDFRPKKHILEKVHQFMERSLLFQDTDTVLEDRYDALYRTLLADRIIPIGELTTVGLQQGEAQRLWRSWLRVNEGGKVTEHNEDAVRFANSLYAAMSDRDLVMTEKGCVGLVDTPTEVGDQIYLFKGSKVLFCIRRSGRPSDQTYKLVGECYLQGFMNGEGMEHINSDDSWDRVKLI